MKELKITPRLWFAGQALHKLIEMYPAKSEADLAGCAFRYADAMIAENNKQKE